MELGNWVILLCAGILGFALAWVGFRTRILALGSERGVLDRIFSMDSEQRLMVLTLIGLVTGLTVAVYLVSLILNKSVSDAGIAAMIGAVIGTILTATVTQPWGYWFGSSKGSADKSAQAHAQAMAQEPAAPEKKV